MAGRIIRRGTNAERVALGGASVAEFIFETDTKDLYVGAAGGDQLVSDASAWAHLGGQDQAVKTTSSPTFANVKLPAAVVGQTNGIYEGTETLIRAFEPIDALERSIFIGRSGNNTMGGGLGLGCKIEAFGDEALVSVTTGNALVGIGTFSLNKCTTGNHIVAVGDFTCIEMTTEEWCTALGTNALRNAVGCSHSIAIGVNALRYATAGGNIAIGNYSQQGSALGGAFTGNVTVGGATLSLTLFTCYTTVIGNEAFYSMATGQHGGVALGYQAGYYETAGNKLFIDNTARASEADGRIKALVYGIFAAASADQRLRINGRLGVTECPNYADNAAAVAGGLASGELYTVTGTDPLQVAKVI